MIKITVRAGRVGNNDRDRRYEFPRFVERWGESRAAMIRIWWSGRQTFR